MSSISKFGVLIPGDKLLGALDAYYCTVEGVSEQGGVPDIEHGNVVRTPSRRHWTACNGASRGKCSPTDHNVDRLHRTERIPGATREIWRVRPIVSRWQRVSNPEHEEGEKTASDDILELKVRFVGPDRVPDPRSGHYDKAGHTAAELWRRLAS